MTSGLALRNRRIEASARSLGVSVEELTTAVRLAYRIWYIRLPWRLVPRWLRWPVYRLFAVRFTNRTVAAMISESE